MLKRNYFVIIMEVTYLLVISLEDKNNQSSAQAIYKNEW